MMRWALIEHVWTNMCTCTSCMHRVYIHTYMYILCVWWLQMSFWCIVTPKFSHPHSPDLHKYICHVYSTPLYTLGFCVYMYSLGVCVCVVLHLASQFAYHLSVESPTFSMYVQQSTTAQCHVYEVCQQVGRVKSLYISHLVNVHIDWMPNIAFCPHLSSMYIHVYVYSELESDKSHSSHITTVS